MIQFGQSESEKAIGSRRAVAGKRKKNRCRADKKAGKRNNRRNSKNGLGVNKHKKNKKK